MKVVDILGEGILTKVMFKALKRKKNNPKPSKTTKIGSFIDVFGGMAGYSNTDSNDKGYRP